MSQETVSHKSALPPPAIDTQTLREQIRHSYNTGDIPGAKRLAQQLLDHDPHDLAVRWLYVIITEDEDERQAALKKLAQKHLYHRLSDRCIPHFSRHPYDDSPTLPQGVRVGPFIYIPIGLFAIALSTLISLTILKVFSAAQFMNFIGVIALCYFIMLCVCLTITCIFMPHWQSKLYTQTQARHLCYWQGLAEYTLLRKHAFVGTRQRQAPFKELDHDLEAALNACTPLFLSLNNVNNFGQSELLLHNHIHSVLLLKNYLSYLQYHKWQQHLAHYANQLDKIALALKQCAGIQTEMREKYRDVHLQIVEAHHEKELLQERLANEQRVTNGLDDSMKALDTIAHHLETALPLCHTYEKNSNAWNSLIYAYALCEGAERMLERVKTALNDVEQRRAAYTNALNHTAEKLHLFQQAIQADATASPRINVQEFILRYQHWLKQKDAWQHLRPTSQTYQTVVDHTHRLIALIEPQHQRLQLKRTLLASVLRHCDAFITVVKQLKKEAEYTLEGLDDLEAHQHSAKAYLLQAGTLLCRSTDARWQTAISEEALQRQVTEQMQVVQQELAAIKEGREHKGQLLHQLQERLNALASQLRPSSNQQRDVNVYTFAQRHESWSSDWHRHVNLSGSPANYDIIKRFAETVLVEVITTENQLAYKRSLLSELITCEHDLEAKRRTVEDEKHKTMAGWEPIDEILTVVEQYLQDVNAVLCVSTDALWDTTVKTSSLQSQATDPLERLQWQLNEIIVLRQQRDTLLEQVQDSLHSLNQSIFNDTIETPDVDTQEFQQCYATWIDAIDQHKRQPMSASAYRESSLWLNELVQGIREAHKDLHDKRSLFIKVRTLKQRLERFKTNLASEGESPKTVDGLHSYVGPHREIEDYLNDRVRLLYTQTTEQWRQIVTNAALASKVEEPLAILEGKLQEIIKLRKSKDSVISHLNTALEGFGEAIRKDTSVSTDEFSKGLKILQQEHRNLKQMRGSPQNYLAIKASTPEMLKQINREIERLQFKRRLLMRVEELQKELNDIKKLLDEEQERTRDGMDSIRNRFNTARQELGKMHMLLQSNADSSWESDLREPQMNVLVREPLRLVREEVQSIVDLRRKAKGYLDRIKREVDNLEEKILIYRSPDKYMNTSDIQNKCRSDRININKWEGFFRDKGSPIIYNSIITSIDILSNKIREDVDTLNSRHELVIRIQIEHNKINTEGNRLHNIITSYRGIQYTNISNRISIILKSAQNICESSKSTDNNQDITILEKKIINLLNSPISDDKNSQDSLNKIENEIKEYGVIYDTIIKYKDVDIVVQKFLHSIERYNHNEKFSEHISNLNNISLRLIDISPKPNNRILHSELIKRRRALQKFHKEIAYIASDIAILSHNLFKSWDDEAISWKFISAFSSRKIEIETIQEEIINEDVSSLYKFIDRIIKYQNEHINTIKDYDKIEILEDKITRITVRIRHDFTIDKLDEFHKIVQKSEYLKNEAKKKMSSVQAIETLTHAYNILEYERNNMPLIFNTSNVKIENAKGTVIGDGTNATQYFNQSTQSTHQDISNKENPDSNTDKSKASNSE